MAVVAGLLGLALGHRAGYQDDHARAVNTSPEPFSNWGLSFFEGWPGGGGGVAGHTQYPWRLVWRWW